MELEVFRNGSNRPSSLTCGLHATLTLQPAAMRMRPRQAVCCACRSRLQDWPARRRSWAAWPAAIRSAERQKSAKTDCSVIAWEIWLRGLDLNQRPSGYEPDELPDCSTPRQWSLRWLRVCSLETKKPPLRLDRAAAFEYVNGFLS